MNDVMITQPGFESVDKVIGSAEKFGALSAAAIWALIAISLAIYLYRWKKMEAAETLKRLEAWLEASKAEEHQTEALKTIAERTAMNAVAINGLAEKIGNLSVVLEERVPRRAI